MAVAFDTLGYVQRLRAAGVPAEQAEAHAEATRDFIMTELATRADMQMLRGEMKAMHAEMQTTRAELSGRMDRVDVRFDQLEDKFDRLEEKVGVIAEQLTLRLTVRLGVLMVAGISALGLALRLT